jgi:hypothetical protein
MFATLGVGTSPEVLVTVADVMSQFSPLSQSSWPPLVVVTAHATMDNILTTHFVIAVKQCGWSFACVLLNSCFCLH